MECISALYEQKIMAQHINYAILEDAYLIEASKEKKPFKERVLEIVDKVLAFIRKFFTETLPKVLESLSNKMDRLTHQTIKCIDPALIEKQYKLGVQTYDDYCKAVEKYHNDVIKLFSSNDEDITLEEYETPLDVNEFMRNAGMKTVDELDNAPMGRHTVKEYQKAIDNINAMSETINEKQAAGLLNEIKESVKKASSEYSVFSEKYFSNVLKSATSISTIITRLDDYLNLAIKLFKNFKAVQDGVRK